MEADTAAPPGLMEQFWHPGFWLPPNVTWGDFRRQDGYVYTADKHLFSLVIPVAALISGLQYVVEKYCLYALGNRIGVSRGAATKTTKQDEVLEKAYKSSKKVSEKQIAALAKQLDWTETEVLDWLKRRADQEKPSPMDRFCRSGWRSLFFVFSFSLGLAALWDKPWLWDLKECWTGFPLTQSLTDDVYSYYLVYIGFSFGLVVAQFFEKRGKDYWAMFIHHIATVILLSFSWVSGLYRIGSVVILIHDFADIFLEAAKMANHAKWKKTSEVIFGLFIVSWIATRNIAFPFWLLRSALTESAVYGNFPALIILNSALCILLVLHVLWTFSIARVCYKVFVLNQVDDDVEDS